MELDHTARRAATRRGYWCAKIFLAHPTLAEKSRRVLREAGLLHLTRFMEHAGVRAARKQAANRNSADDRALGELVDMLEGVAARLDSAENPRTWPSDRTAAALAAATLGGPRPSAPPNPNPVPVAQPPPVLATPSLNPPTNLPAPFKAPTTE